MKAIRISLFLVSIIAMHAPVFADDAVYCIEPSQPSAVAIERDLLVIRKHLVKIPPPKGKSLIFYTTSDPDGYYIVMLGLDKKPPEGFRPVIVLGESTLMDEVEVGGNRVIGYSITLRTKDKAQAEEWNKRIETLFFPDQSK